MNNNNNKLDGFLAKEYIKSQIRRVVLSIFPRTLKGSATIEASLVIPIFIFAYLAIMQLLWVIVAQIGIVNALYDTGMSMCRNSMVLEDKTGMSSAQMAVAFYSSLNKDYVENAGIVGKSMGITLLNSDISEDLSSIYLRTDYISTNNLLLSSIFVHNYTQSLYFSGWTGCNVLNRDEVVDNSRVVYITDYGEVYHTNRGCAYLNPSITQTVTDRLESLRNDSRERYTPCKACYQNTKVIYITNYGNAYHSNRNCMGLKRGIMSVNIADIGNLRLCSKCSRSK